MQARSLSLGTVWTGSRSARTALGLRRLGMAAGLGLVLTLLQTLLLCLLAGQPDFPSAYRTLLQWDSGWFAGITLNGYHSPAVMKPGDFGNVAFFPGYPLLARLTMSLTGLPFTYALPLASQAACCGFWIYFFLFLWRWQVSSRSIVIATLAIVSQPAAFFMVTGYSEGLFTFAMMGYLYWCDRGGRLGHLLAVPHGLVLTATRLVGLPLVVYPLVRAWFADSDLWSHGRLQLRKVLFLLLCSVGAALGMILFFAFCQGKFGQWDLYFRTIEFNWKLKANYLALFSHKTYIINLFRSSDGFIEPDWLSQVTTLAMLAGFVWLLRVEWKLARSGKDTGWRQRVGYHFAVAALLFLNICGRHDVRMMGMIRYLHSVEIVLIVAVLHLLPACPSDERRQRRIAWRLGVWIALSFLCELVYMYRFTHGKWVA